MKTSRNFSLTEILRAVALAAFALASTNATGATLNAIFNSAADVPVTASGYTATGNTVNFTLNYAPATGTDLMVVQNTGLGFINGTFDNLAQGQPVALSYGGVTYRFVANYYGGSGNDLVLVWANTRPFAWGDNYLGKLGDNTFEQYRLLPVSVTSSGVLAGKKVLSITAGFYHSLALCSDGSVAAWGDNWLSELGDNGDAGFQSCVPVAVNSASGISTLYGKQVVAIAVGTGHSLALCSDGTVAAWGRNDFGQLGDNSTRQRATPVTVNTSPGISALYGKTVVAIAAGAYHSLALCSDGSVAAWGYNGYGQLGNNTTVGASVPVAVNTAPGVSVLSNKTVVVLAAGLYHSLALCSDGSVAAWGYNGYGQLGDNTTVGASVAVAVNTAPGVSVLSNKTVMAIAAGGHHSLALCSDGTVAAWGYNDYGQLGNNSTAQRHVPVAVNTTPGVSALAGKTVVAITVGLSHSLALCADGTVAAWGLNISGELGDTTTTERHVPVAVNTGALAASQRFTRVTSGSAASHALALVAGSPNAEFTLAGARRLTNGSLRFVFTNAPGTLFGVLAASNSAMPLSNWTSLTGLTEVSPGQFQFTDPQATNSPRRFYRVRSP